MRRPTCVNRVGRKAQSSLIGYLSMAAASVLLAPLFSVSILISVSMLRVFVPSADAYAQPNLLNSSAIKKAAEKQRSAGDSRSGRLGGSFASGSGSLAQDLRLDTVEDILWESKKDPAHFRNFRGLRYLSYVGDAVDLEVEEIDELEQTSFAKKLLLFQTARSIAHHITGTPLERFYRRVVRMAKSARDYTTFRLVENESGDIGVSQGDEAAAVKESDFKPLLEPREPKKLIEFKLHASAKNGVEPRIKFSEDVVLRLDPLGKDALLEFKQDF